MKIKIVRQYGGYRFGVSRVTGLFVVHLWLWNAIAYNTKLWEWRDEFLLPHKVG